MLEKVSQTQRKGVAKSRACFATVMSPPWALHFPPWHPLRRSGGVWGSARAFVGIQAPCDRVELDVRTANLVLVVDVEQVEALDLVLASADVREGPVPCGEKMLISRRNIKRFCSLRELTDDLVTPDNHGVGLNIHVRVSGNLGDPLRLGSCGFAAELSQCVSESAVKL